MEETKERAVLLGKSVRAAAEGSRARSPGKAGELEKASQGSASVSLRMKTANPGGKWERCFCIESQQLGVFRNNEKRRVAERSHT